MIKRASMVLSQAGRGVTASSYQLGVERVASDEVVVERETQAPIMISATQPQHPITVTVQGGGGGNALFAPLNDFAASVAAGMILEYC